MWPQPPFCSAECIQTLGHHYLCWYRNTSKPLFNPCLFSKRFMFDKIHDCITILKMHTFSYSPASWYTVLLAGRLGEKWLIYELWWFINWFLFITPIITRQLNCTQSRFCIGFPLYTNMALVSIHQMWQRMRFNRNSHWLQYYQRPYRKDLKSLVLLWLE